jgi:hypothetical protein
VKGQTRACHVYAVLFNSFLSTAARAGVMENCPPHRLAPPTSLMHSRSNSKSSPAKRDATRILAPQHNNNASASENVFDTGLLTPQASQNTFDPDAATSLISPPPEDTTRAGLSRQSVRVALPIHVLAHQPIMTPVLVDQRWFRTCLEFASRCKHRQRV